MTRNSDKDGRRRLLYKNLACAPCANLGDLCHSCTLEKTCIIRLKHEAPRDSQSVTPSGLGRSAGLDK